MVRTHHISSYLEGNANVLFTPPDIFRKALSNRHTQKK